jgi:hypothetical protein
MDFGREREWLACMRRTRTESTAELKRFNGNDPRTFHTLMRFESNVKIYSGIDVCVPAMLSSASSRDSQPLSP